MSKDFKKKYSICFQRQYCLLSSCCVNTCLRTLSWETSQHQKNQPILIGMNASYRCLWTCFPTSFCVSSYWVVHYIPMVLWNQDYILASMPFNSSTAGKHSLAVLLSLILGCSFNTGMQRNINQIITGTLPLIMKWKDSSISFIENENRNCYWFPRPPSSKVTIWQILLKPPITSDFNAY